VSIWLAVAFCGGGLAGWIGGYCYGWLMGTKDTERRWSDAVTRKEHDDAYAEAQRALLHRVMRG
jgi:hypothetical protein